jgi:hypothetical protein
MRGSISTRVARAAVAPTVALVLSLAWAVAAQAGPADTLANEPGAHPPAAGQAHAHARLLRPIGGPDARTGSWVPTVQLTGADQDAAARAASSTGWRKSVIRHYGAKHDASGYSAVVAPGGSSAWVFGGTNPGGTSAPVALQWDGTQWRARPLPKGLTGFISDASASGRRDIWAVSAAGGYVLHWNGVRWSVAKTWHVHGALTGVTALSPRNVWVFGTTAAGLHGMGTWHFNGRTWTSVGGAAQQISRASAVSGRDIWAVATTRNRGMVEQFNGRAWRPVNTGRALAGAHLDDVLAVSRHDVWIVGNLPGRHGDGRLILAHFNGRRWIRIMTRWNADTGRLAPAGHDAVWVTADNSGSRSTALIGRVCVSCAPSWSIMRWGQGTGISDIAVSRKTGTIWVTGGFLTAAGGDAAVWVHRKDHSRFDDIDQARIGGPLVFGSRRL